MSGSARGLVVRAVVRRPALLFALPERPPSEPAGSFGSARRGALLQAALGASIAVLVVLLTALTLRLARQKR